MTKRDRVLQHLLKGKTITKIQALSWFRMLNLGDAVYVLRNRGYDIQHEMKKRNGTTYATYWMEAQRWDYMMKKKYQRQPK